MVLVRSSRMASRLVRSAATASSSSANASGSSRSRRCLHTCPPTPEVLADGCAPFMSRSTVHQISQQWQGGLLDLLNQEVRDTEYATASIVETVIGLARKRDKVLAFNYASQALNNSFFLSTLAPQRSLRQATPHPKMWTAISKSFSSYPEMCLAFSSAAYGMAGSGWVWLVTDQHRNLGVIPTYGAGTVIVQNRMQRGRDFLLPSVNDQTTGSQSEPTADNAEAQQQPPSSATSNSQNRPGRPTESLFSGLGITDEVGKEIYPLLNISVHEHTWLNDYGIMGKEEYLTRFWNCVDWSKVEERFESYCPQSSRLI